MSTKRILSSFTCTLLPTLGVLYMIRYMAVEIHFNSTALYWVSFICAIIGLIMNIWTWGDGVDFSIHTFNFHCFFVAFGFLAFTFKPELTKWVNGEAWMTVLVAVHLIISALGFITLWCLTHDAMDSGD